MPCDALPCSERVCNTLLTGVDNLHGIRTTSVRRAWFGCVSMRLAGQLPDLDEGTGDARGADREPMGSTVLSRQRVPNASGQNSDGRGNSRDDRPLTGRA